MAYIGKGVIGVEHPSTSALTATSVTSTGAVSVTGNVTASDDFLGSSHLKIGTTTDPSAGGSRIVANVGGGSFSQFHDSDNNKGAVFGTVAGASQIYTYTGAVGSETYTLRQNITADGEVTMPTQPSFLATGSWSYDTNKFWKGFSTIGHNVGSHWNNTTGTWTCPIAGSYLIYANVHHSTISTYHLWCFSKNGNVINSWIQTYNGSSAGENTTASSLITVCAANDTLRFYSNGSYANGYTTGYVTVGVHLIG